MTRKRVLFLSANPSWGGSEESWFRLAGSAAAYGWDASVVARLYDASERHLAVLRGAGVRTHAFPDNGGLAALLERERPDVVHASLGQPLGLLGECEQVVATGVPLVLVEHLIADDYSLADGDDGRRKAAVYRDAARIVYVAERNRRTLSSWVGDKRRTAVVTHGIDLTRFTPAPFREHAKPLRAVCVARLAMRHKGLDTLIETAALAAGAVEIDLIGDGPARDELVALAESRGVPFRLRGAVRDVAAALHDYDAFVLLSRYEGKPTAIAEAMASGLPCVVTDVGGQPEIVRDGVSGFVVPPDDAEAAAARLRVLAGEPRLRSRMRENGIAIAHRELDWTDTERAFFAIYDEAARSAS